MEFQNLEKNPSATNFWRIQ